MGRTFRSRLALRSVLVAAMLATASCGGNGDDDAAEMTAASALTDDDLEAALLTPEEVGAGWHAAGAEPMEIGDGEDLSGRCPTGSSFSVPRAAMLIDFGPPDELADNTISQALMTFESRAELDAWTMALESCVGERWEELDDPVEHVTVEAIDVAEHGDDRAGFLLSFAHGDDEEPAHLSRWYLVRVGGVLVLVTGEDYDLDCSEDEAHLADVVAKAVDKAEATLQS
jgi:hypothetical protein